jgi:ABC-type multidrug transport system ATPase subunit
MSEVNLLMITGQEGAGKSTTIRALGQATPSSARIDAEDVSETNPWQMDDAFMRLL